MTEKLPETLTLTQLAKFLGLKTRTLHRMTKDGRFPVIPLKGLKPRRWCKEAVTAWRFPV